MSRLRAALRQLPVPLAGMLVGCVVLGAIGGLVGLVLGLRAYPPTAWFAILEVGVPAGLIGCFLGFVFGFAERVALGPRTGPDGKERARRV